MCDVYACIHVLSMIHVYMCLYFALCYAMLIVDPCFSVVYLLLRKTGASVIVQVRSDAG